MAISMETNQLLFKVVSAILLIALNSFSSCTIGILVIFASHTYWSTSHKHINIVSVKSRTLHGQVH